VKDKDMINYDRIGKAQAFYNAIGYKNLDVAWIVSPKAVQVTKPPNNNMFEIPGCGVCVGSGEQSFIEMMIQGKLDPGRFQCTTPCFRDEEKYTDITRMSFMKTELIWYIPDDPKAALNIVFNNAMSCFFELSYVDTFEIIQTKEGLDIYYNAIELGSYGVREWEGHTWVYGTGLAEPRFTIALMRQHEKAIESMAKKDN
jgi:hypothetical protein